MGIETFHSADLFLAAVKEKKIQCKNKIKKNFKKNAFKKSDRMRREGITKTKLTSSLTKINYSL